uniref:Platelet-derived growth factor receptor-like protein n=1 Tax=Amazona collaria TaxID=241587 RepID=A0A8B9FH64_9PSIT
MTRVGTLGTLVRTRRMPKYCLKHDSTFNPGVLRYRGAPSVSWLLREDQKEDPRVHISSCHNSTRQSCSMLVMRRVTANDTGYFTCIHDDSPTDEDLMARIYVFVKDYRNPFVEIHPEHPEIIYILDAKKTFVVPCRVTSPDIKPKLTKYPYSVEMKFKRMVWDPRRGFVIPSHAFIYSGVLTCTATVNGSVFTSYYLGRVQNLALKATPKKLLVGETLYLECRAETFINGRIELIWTSPSGKVILCRGTSPLLSSCSSLFPDKPFITVSHKKGPYYEITSGHKSLKLAAKVDAFPRPTVTWYKDGKLIKDNHTCYEPDPLKYRLGIRDVRPKHAGNYTIVLSNTKYGLYKNLTMQLVVTGKDLMFIMTSTRFFLIFCVVLLYLPVGMASLITRNYFVNCFSTIKHTTTLQPHCKASSTLKAFSLCLQIVSTLTMENSSASGIYYCVASNKIGEEERSIEFYVSDVPFGLQTAPQVTTIVGNNVRLTCRASKYIYSHLGWYFPSSEAAPTHSLIRNTNNYSISLTLVITNVTKEQSGLYRCRAQNQHNSTDTLEQHTQLLVRGTSCQQKAAMGHGGVLLHLLLPLMPFKHPCMWIHTHYSCSHCWVWIKYFPYT